MPYAPTPRYFPRRFFVRLKSNLQLLFLKNNIKITACRFDFSRTKFSRTNFLRLFIKYGKKRIFSIQISPLIKKRF